MSFSIKLVGIKLFWQIQTKGVIGKINFWLLVAFVFFSFLSFLSREASNTFAADLHLNITAEVAGVWMAFVLINEVIRRDQEKRALPARTAALRRIRSVHHDISRFWMSLVLQGANFDNLRKAILDIEGLKLFDKRLAKTINSIDLTSDALTLVDKPMSVFVYDWALSIQRKIELIVQGYAQYLSPNMLAALDHVENNPFIAYLAGDIDDRLSNTKAFYNQTNVTAPESMFTAMWNVIGTHWYEDFIPSVNELGRVIAEEIQFVDMEDLLKKSDDQLRMSVGSEPPLATNFDPECKDKLEELLLLLRMDLNRDSLGNDVSDD